MKQMNVVRKYGVRLGQGAVVSGGLLLASLAHATGDYDTIVAAADWSPAKTAVIAIGGALMLVIVAIVGLGFVLGAARRK